MTGRERSQPEVDKSELTSRGLSTIAKILQFPTNVDLTASSGEKDPNLAMVLDAEELLSTFLLLDAFQRKKCIMFVNNLVKES